jgi:Ca2+-binding RTX toxin-like protein
VGGAGADLLDGDGGTGDWADYTGALTSITVRLWNGTGVGGDADGDVLIEVENLRGGAAGDSLIGADAQTNVLEGAAGADYLNGLSGDDSLYGGTEADILDGAAGNDRLDGGTGADDFVFGTGSGADVVVLFEDGSDQVDLTGALTFTGLTLTAIAGGVRAAITATPTDMIDLMGVTLGQIDAGDFI